MTAAYDVCFQKFVGAGDIFDAEMDSSDDDSDDNDDGGDDGDSNHRKQEHRNDLPENKGEFC